MTTARDEGQQRAPGHIHVQHATAADAAVVIQVGHDLYVSDASLSALWASAETAPGECPFPGLDAFGPGQAKWFFGRERLTGDLLQELDNALLADTGGPVLVVGPSGAGKSSLLGAGLLTALGEGRLPATGAEAWPRVLVTPGAHPLQTLREALATCARARDDAARAVIVVDQLEEIFTACRDEAERSAFLAELAGLASAESRGGNGPAAVIVLGLRADFYAQATGYQVLRAAMQSRQVVLGAMTPTEVLQAITLPARAAGLSLDDGLAERLLRDLGVDEAGGYEPGRLPLLAHALRATWQRRDGDRLTIAGYQATGGMHGAIAKTAEDVYARLDDAGQRVARRVFLALVRVGEAASDADGEGTADTRRRVSAESLYASASDAATARAVLDAFTAARLLTSGGQAVEITHEALLRRWPRLRDWIAEDRSGNLVRQNLEDAAGIWDRENRDAAGLYGGVRLAAAHAWAAADPGRPGELSPAARDFLTASDRRRRRSVRRRNEVIAILAALSLVLAGLTGFAFSQRTAAQTNERQAQANERQAEGGELAEQSAVALSNQQPDLAMEFAVQAQRLAPSSPQALGALLGTQSLHIAGRLIVGHTGVGVTKADARSVAYSPDGALLATSSANGYVQLWSTSTYREVWSSPLLAFAGRDVIVDSVAFSPDGRILAATAIGGVYLWNVANPARPVSLGIFGTGSTTYASSYFAFSPDGETLATADSPGTGSSLVRLWNLSSHALDGTISPGADIDSLAFADGGRMLATADENGGVKLWDVSRRSLADVLQSPAGLVSLAAVTASPDGQTIAFSGPENSHGQYPVELWSVARHQITATLPADDTVAVTTLAFSPDGDMLASGGGDGAVKLWDMQDGGALLDTLTGHNAAPVNKVAFDPDGGAVASAGNDGSVVLWDVRGNTLDSRTNPAIATAFSPDGHLLAVGVNVDADITGQPAVVALYSMPTGTRVATLRTATGSETVTDMVFSPDGDVLAVALDDPPSSTVQLWNVASHRLIGQLQTRQEPFIRGLAFSPDGRLLATSSPVGPVVRLWDTTRLSQVAALSLQPLSTDNEGGYTVAFSPNGALLAVANVAGSSELFDVAQRRIAEIFLVPDASESLAFSPDGRTVAIGDVSGTVYTYTVRPRAKTNLPADLSDLYQYPNPSGTFSDSTQTITSVAFETGGRTLIAAGADGVVRLWNVSQGTLEASVTASTKTIWSMSYSGSLGLIVTADGVVTRVWHTDPGLVAADICRTLRAPVPLNDWKSYLPGTPYMQVCA
ncbi:MAG: WD40 repeat domain-containing protein [Trebonia sp.]|jgi:WD40 repeat protein